MTYFVVPTAEQIAYVIDHMRADDRREIFSTRWDQTPAGLARDIEAQTLKVCACAGSDPVAIVNAFHAHPGYWQVFLLATDGWPRVSLGMTRFMRRELIPTLFLLGAHRIESISACWRRSDRWLSSVGALPGALLEEYGGNREDYRIWEWRRPNVKEQ